jgi:hypothetical protein
MAAHGSKLARLYRARGWGAGQLGARLVVGEHLFMVVAQRGMQLGCEPTMHCLSC